MEPLMPVLTIKGLPEPLYRRLREQAEAHHRSLNGEIIACLERALGPTRMDPAAWLAEAAAFHERLKLKPLTRRQLAAARKAGRA
jgi:plasmid stability protein